jgi:hypothetical protein
MWQSPCEADSRSGDQEIPCLLWNSYVYYCVNNGPPLATVSNRIDSNRIPSRFKINFNIVLRFMTWLFCSRLPNKICYTFLIPVLPATCPSHHLSSFSHGNNIWWRVQCTYFLVCSFLQPPVTSSLWGPNTQHPVLKHPQSVFFP